MLRPRDQRFLSVLKNPCVRWITPGRAAALGLTALRARCGDDCGESPEPPQSLQLSSDADLLRCLRRDEHFDLPLLPLDVATERSAISTVPALLLLTLTQDRFPRCAREIHRLWPGEKFTVSLEQADGWMDGEMVQPLVKPAQQSTHARHTAAAATGCS